MEKLLNPHEIADVLGVQPSTIYQWTHQGYIPYIKIGKFIRFKSTDIEKWVEKKSKGGRIIKRIEINSIL
nr:helix-turn-helix domain-containing protein [candidate division Zixibacteria bacterium]